MYNPRFYQQQTNGINWVQGIEGAKAWQLAPNSNTVLLDSENDKIFYIKTSDNIGMCMLRKFKYEEVLPEETAGVDLKDYVRKSELQDLLNEMLGGTKDESVVSTVSGKSSLF